MNKNKKTKTIRFHKVELIFKPANSSYGTGLSKPVHATLSICFDRNAAYTIKKRFENLNKAEAELIYKIAHNESLALVESKSKKTAIARFAHVKVNLIPDVVPTTNWSQIELWYRLNKQLIELENRIAKMNKEVWKMSSDDEELKFKINDVVEMLQRQQKEIQLPINQPAIGFELDE